ncbi:VWA domain-containing protein [Nemorincola caseinilytica]|uniref:VWA domain-containing protein n=1 Tax=Nemorincola caseinilytica TaxID=2054315 RepID=A0ABP8NMG0_9BACT
MRQLMDLEHMSFAHPWFFLLLLVVPLMIWWQLRGRRNEQPVMRLTSLSGLVLPHGGTKARYRPVLFVLRVISVLMLIIALARPQSSNTTENVDSDGIDIVLCMDISGSMLAEDFKPNRMEAAKKQALSFIDERTTDRIGLVVFAGESFTLCPITIDHNVLKTQVARIESSLLTTSGTAIGSGLASAVGSLRPAKGKSKVVILMTDGTNNVNGGTTLDPATATEIAKLYGVRVYAIAIGTMGQALIPVPTPTGVQKMMMPTDVDEPLLKRIAAATNGKFYRATGNRSLADIYKDIDQLERTKVSITSYKHYAELFFPFAMVAVICLALEMILRYTVFRSVT